MLDYWDDFTWVPYYELDITLLEIVHWNNYVGLFWNDLQYRLIVKKSRRIIKLESLYTNREFSFNLIVSI